MNIALLGYGKMGRIIEKLASERGHSIELVFDSKNASSFNVPILLDYNIDVAIEFSVPSSALKNICTCFKANIPVVSGTTAWLDHWNIALENMIKNDGTLLYASNFSVGVNILFAVNKYLAKLMNNRLSYDSSIIEIHHTSKIDAPSGTALKLGNDIIDLLERKEYWVDSDPKENELLISSKRIDDVPGTHYVNYENSIDKIVLSHEAKSRKGFALGALLAAEYIKDKKGLFTMKDVLNLKLM